MYFLVTVWIYQDNQLLLCILKSGIKKKTHTGYPVEQLQILKKKKTTNDQ